VFILFFPFKRLWVVLQSRRKAADNSKRIDKKSTSDAEDESEEEKAEEDEEEEEEEEQENVEEQNENGALEKSDAEISEHSESEEKNESVEESEENSRKRKKRSATSLRKKAPCGKAKTRISVSHKSSPSVKRTPKKSSSKHILSDEDSDASPKVSPMKKKTEKV
jgi:protein DEK